MRSVVQAAAVTVLLVSLVGCKQEVREPSTTVTTVAEAPRVVRALPVQETQAQRDRLREIGAREFARKTAEVAAEKASEERAVRDAEEARRAAEACAYMAWIESLCPICEGNGNVVCTFCEWDGYADCSLCAGGLTVDRDRCDFCAGQGRHRCTLCNGTKRYSCVFCGGTGLHP
jgi:hypothetical protein